MKVIMTQDMISTVLHAFESNRNQLDIVDEILFELQFYGEKQLVPALIKILNDSEEKNRLLALYVLEEFGMQAEPALPAIIDSLDDSSKDIRLAAVDIVGRFGAKSKEAVPILDSWIGDRDQSIHVVAVGKILLIDSDRAGELMPLLIDELKSDDYESQIEIIKTLKHLGKMAQDAVPALQSLNFNNVADNLDKCYALFKITGDATESIKLATDLLDDDETFERELGAEHLGQLGAGAFSAIPKLLWMTINEKEESVLTEVQLALDKILLDVTHSDNPEDSAAIREYVDKLCAVAYALENNLNTSLPATILPK